MIMKKMSVKQLLGASAEWLIIMVVAAFLAMQSIEFWKFVTPDDKPLWVWFGFGLTGGGMIAYLMIIMWRADTAFKKYIAIAMLVVCTLGELATAGFGIKILANKIATRTSARGAKKITSGHRTSARSIIIASAIAPPFHIAAKIVNARTSAEAMISFV